MVYIKPVVFSCLLVICVMTEMARTQTPEEALETFKHLQSERQQQGLKPLTLTDLINLLGDEEKRKVLRDVAEKDIFYIQVQGRWKLIDDPLTALRWTYREDEPWSHRGVRCPRTHTSLVNRQ